MLWNGPPLTGRPVSFVPYGLRLHGCGANFPKNATEVNVYCFST